MGEVSGPICRRLPVMITVGPVLPFTLLSRTKLVKTGSTHGRSNIPEQLATVAGIVEILVAVLSGVMDQI